MEDLVTVSTVDSTIHGTEVSLEEDLTDLVEEALTTALLIIQLQE